MGKTSVVYYHEKKITGLSILGLFVFAGLLLSFSLPGMLYPKESHSQYITHVYIFLVPVDLAFFAAGFTVSSFLRKKRIIGRVVGDEGKSPNVRTEIIIPKNSYEKIQGIDPVRNLEARMDFFRISAETDPQMLPELAKRLITLALMCREKDTEKSKQYMDEARGILKRKDYPDTREGIEVRNLGRDVGI